MLLRGGQFESSDGLGQRQCAARLISIAAFGRDRGTNEKALPLRERRPRRHLLVYSSDETVEIVVEAVNDLARSDRGRFVLLNLPKRLFWSALGEAAQRNGTPGPRRA